MIQKKEEHDNGKFCDCYYSAELLFVLLMEIKKEKQNTNNTLFHCQENSTSALDFKKQRSLIFSLVHEEQNQALGV